MACLGQICLVAGHNRGFTRTIVEALLKRGSKVIFTSGSPEKGDAEQFRLGQLYGSSKVHCAHVDHTREDAMEELFVKTLDIFGGVNMMVSATGQDSVRVEEGLDGMDMDEVERKVNNLVLENDVRGARRSYRLSVKYMGKHNGHSGGTVLNIPSSAELSGPRRPGSGGCTVLGTTRGLGLSRPAAVHGVKVVTLYQPTIDYPDIGQSRAGGYVGSYSPSTVNCDKMRDYSREYTGYMALHAADTAQTGSAWAFGHGLKLNEVTVDDISFTCGIANKMCFWLGCPMLDDQNLLSSATKAKERASPATSIPSQECQDS